MSLVTFLDQVSDYPKNLDGFEVKIIGESNPYPFFKLDIDTWSKFDTKRQGSPTNDPAALARDINAEYEKKKMSYCFNNGVIAIIDEKGELYVTAIPTMLDVEGAQKIQNDLLQDLQSTGYARRDFFIPLSENSQTSGDYLPGAISERSFTNANIIGLVNRLFAANIANMNTSTGSNSEEINVNGNTELTLSTGNIAENLTLALSNKRSDNLQPLSRELESMVITGVYSIEAISTLMATTERVAEDLIARINNLNISNSIEDKLTDNEVVLVEYLLEFRSKILEKLRGNSSFSTQVNRLSQRISIDLHFAYGKYLNRDSNQRELAIKKSVDKYWALARTPEFKNKYLNSNKLYVKDMTTEQVNSELLDWEALIDDTDNFYNFLFNREVSPEGEKPAIGYLTVVGRLESLIKKASGLEEYALDLDTLRYNPVVIRIIRKLLTTKCNPIFIQGQDASIWKVLSFEGGDKVAGEEFRIFQTFIYVFRSVMVDAAKGSIFAERFSEVISLMNLFVEGKSEENRTIPYGIIDNPRLTWGNTLLKDQALPEGMMSFSMYDNDARTKSILKLKNSLAYLEARKSA